jgi:predicted permease
MVYLEAFSKVLPVLLLFALGAFFRRTGFLQPAAIQDMKKLIVNVTLPAVLFMAFAAVTLEARHLAVAGLVFAACTVVLIAGRFLQGAVGADSAYLPPLLTGFEAGMMGYAIFTAVYGAEAVFNFAVVDLGQVVFVFFILVPLVQRLGVGAAPFSQTVRGFLTTAVILSIFAGILFNRLGLMTALTAFPLTNAVFDTLGLLGAVTTPLIGIVIGYEVNLQHRGLSAPIRTIGVRLAIWVVLGLLLNALVVSRLFPGDRMLQAAVMTMFVLPPPFVIPLFMRNATPEEQRYVVNTLSLATLVTLLAFTVVSVIYPPI